MKGGSGYTHPLKRDNSYINRVSLGYVGLLFPVNGASVVIYLTGNGANGVIRSCVMTGEADKADVALTSLLSIVCWGKRQSNLQGTGKGAPI